MFALVLAAGVVLSRGAAPVSADYARSGQLHVTKNCNTAGPYCIITSSNLAEIKKNSIIYYASPIVLSTPTGLFDSDAVLYVGQGDWAVGHCTVDNTTQLGLCTFSDGTGSLTGFQARVKVSSPAGLNFGIDYNWDGTYSFTPEPGN